MESKDLDLDGQGGKEFLRVLLSLIMHNYPPLVSGALKLLFRHFSQRQEVLDAFKQVSLNLLWSRMYSTDVVICPIVHFVHAI